jgi:acyl-coenzyme A thioesterase PaaI-like protein
MANVIASALDRISKLPSWMQNWATNLAFRRAVPYVGTSKVHYEKVSEQEWVAYVPNKRSVQNHLGQVHAGAMMVLAESVAVTMMGMNLPPDRLPLVKSLEAKFVRRSSGRIRAIARLTDEQLARIKQEPKGEVVIEVDIRDETGEIPAVITVVPAWTMRRKK